MNPSAPEVPRRLRTARIAVSAVFFVHGAVFASWAARVPAVRDSLHLTTGQLGIVLAGPGLGALAGSQAGGLLTSRLGSRTVSALAPVVLCLPLALVPFARTAWWLMAVLVLLGAADGATSVAMNAQAVTVQRRYGRSVLNGMHATRSAGAVAGGLAGAATAGLGTGLTASFTTCAALLAVVSAVAACGLLPDAAPAPGAVAGGVTAGLGAPGRRQVLLLLAVMTFFGSLVEDAPASWSGVYLRQLHAAPAAAAAGYAAFCAGQVLTRTRNDRLVDRLGWSRLIRTGMLGCAAVLAAALLAGRPGVMLAALVLAGAGCSAVFPGAFATAGALPDPGTAMGQVGFAGNLGWVLVSPIIGGLATLTGLPLALGVLVVAALLVAALSGVTGRADEAAVRPDAAGVRAG